MLLRKQQVAILLFVTSSNPIVQSSTRNKYTYSSDTSTASGVGTASAARAQGAATGNSTRGIFALGLNYCSGATACRNKYTYACCTSTSSGVASSSSSSSYGSATSWAVCVNTPT